VLRLCSAPGMNSLMTPNPPVLESLGQYPTWAQVVAEKPVETRRLDDIAEITAADLLTIDMQGAELPVLGGGVSRLSSAAAVQVKVCFMQLYENQPLFTDIDEVMRARGFTIHIFDEVNRALISPMSFPHDPFQTINHGVYCDIVYVRDFTRIGDIPTDRLRHLALIAYHCFRSFDLVAKCLDGLIARSEAAPDSVDRYIENFNKEPPQ
jgi:hypothetical protein